MRAFTYAMLPLIGVFACSVVNNPDSPAEPGTGGSGNTAAAGGTGGSGAGGPNCMAPEVDCGGVCADTMTATEHCGGCNKPCAMGEFCMAAQCEADCNLTDCGNGVCTDTDTDRDHCGACNMPCDNASVCVAGNCAPCGAPQVPCGNICADLNTDPMNCGSCGMPCAMGEVCDAGTCALCGDNMVEAGEEVDPPTSPFNTASVDMNTCRWDFSQVPQLYCAGTCSWGGPNGCDQADADVFCKLKTGNPASIATTFTLATALAQHGFTCKNSVGTDIGPLPTRGVMGEVRYQDASVLGNHGAGQVITSVTCNPM